MARENTMDPRDIELNRRTGLIGMALTIFIGVAFYVLVIIFFLSGTP